MLRLPIRPHRGFVGIAIQDLGCPLHKLVGSIAGGDLAVELACRREAGTKALRARADLRTECLRGDGELLIIGRRRGPRLDGRVGFKLQMRHFSEPGVAADSARCGIRQSRPFESERACA